MLNICVCIISCSVVSDSYDPVDCSLPGSSVHGIFQARILEWVAIPFSRVSSRPGDQTLDSDDKESACNAGDPSLIPGLDRSPREGLGRSRRDGLGRYPREGNGYPL